MKLRLIVALSLAVAANVAGQPASSTLSEYETNKADAEKLYAEGSFARANAIYRKVDVSQLPDEEARWVAFRVADTQWRSQAGYR